MYCLEYFSFYYIIILQFKLFEDYFFKKKYNKIKNFNFFI